MFNWENFGQFVWLLVLFGPFFYFIAQAWNPKKPPSDLDKLREVLKSLMQEGNK